MGAWDDLLNTGAPHLETQVNRIPNSQQKLLCYYEMIQTAIGFSLRVTLKV